MKYYFLLFVIFWGCHGAIVTRFNDEKYPPTKKVEIFSDLNTIQNEYIEIGYVEAAGGITVSKQSLLYDMIEKAKIHGADALIKVEFYDVGEYNYTLGHIEKPHAKAVMIKYR